MLTKYTKTLYESNAGYRLYHTVGLDAKDSTIDHPHLCPDYMLFYFIHGDGSIQIEGKHYTIHSGDIFFTNPDELFHCTIDPSKYHERIVLHLRPDFLHTLPCDNAPLLHVFQHGIGNDVSAQLVHEYNLDQLLSNILTFVQNPTPANNILVLCKIAELLIQLNHAAEANHSQLPESSNATSLIDMVLEYLNGHFGENISISSVAGRFNINQSHLSHIFKNHTGMSLWNYVTLRRLHMFNHLIRQNHSIEDACYQVGFQNYSNFFRLYKKYMGMTPTEFKRQNTSQSK